VSKIMGCKRVIEHRPVRLPAESLISPRVTQHKILAEGQCRMCGRAHRVRPLTRHHLVPESWFLSQPLPLRLIRNAHANIVPLCRPCHDRVDSREADERTDARRELRRCLGQAEIAFAISVRGKSWLDRYYPRTI
jgi:5-methylcytosine-specific restriction endonuclease McrA